MALAKDRIPHDSSMSSKVQSVFNENGLENTSLMAHGVNEYHKNMLEEEDGSHSTNGLSNDSAITHSPPLCGNGYVYKGTNYQIEEAESLINFKGSSSSSGGGYNNLMEASESFLSFQQSRMVSNNNSYLKDSSEKEYSCVWENDFHQGYNHWNQVSPRSTATELRLVQDFSCFQTASGFSSIHGTAKEKQHGESSYEWLYSEPTTLSDTVQESRAQDSVLKKRHVGEKMKAAKKQCTSESKTPKSNSGPSKDPQSVAAKNRRERISERLKILQELVPNGSKVDLVTMLEKAISYVKFLQLQVKVLATDEFWPVQGEKAPDISQVKEAIDAILSSQRNSSPSSK